MYKILTSPNSSLTYICVCMYIYVYIYIFTHTVTHTHTLSLPLSLVHTHTYLSQKALGRQFRKLSDVKLSLHEGVTRRISGTKVLRNLQFSGTNVLQDLCCQWRRRRAYCWKISVLDVCLVPYSWEGRMHKQYLFFERVHLCVCVFLSLSLSLSLYSHREEALPDGSLRTRWYLNVVWGAVAPFDPLLPPLQKDVDGNASVTTSDRGTQAARCFIWFNTCQRASESKLRLGQYLAPGGVVNWKHNSPPTIEVYCALIPEAEGCVVYYESMKRKLI
jgi:hypothetical protein